MRKIILFTLVAALTISAATAFGAVREGAYSISPLVGGFIYGSNQQFDAAPVLGVRGGYSFTKALGVEAVYDYVTPTDSRYWSLKNIALHRFGGQALYHFVPDNQLVPYLAAGYSGIKFAGTGVNNKLHGAFDYGAGAKYSVTDNIAVRADIRHIMYGYNATTYNNVEFLLGVHFQLGGVAPVVTAVVPVAVPVEPVIAAAVVSPPPAPVKSVAAPVQKAPVPTVEAVPPVVVAPPVIASIAVKAAIEPAKAESAVTALPVKASGYYCNKTTVLIIEFGGGRSAVKGEYARRLDRLGRFMKENPTARGTIEGHTAAGGEARMAKLSKARADSVRDYLVTTFGIDGSRLSAVGYGQARPIASNKTAVGRRKNFRVEAVIVCE